MTDRRENLGLRLGAIFLALATVAAVSFGIINFQQRLLFDVPDDGVSWLDGSSGIQAFAMAGNSPAERAGIKTGDRLLAMDGLAVHRALDVTKRLWAVGLWAQVQYRLERAGQPFQAPVVVEPAPKPVTIENYLRVTGLLYLFIGLFIFARRWNAARAVHFYVFCLVSFILYSFRYTGKLNLFDWEIYWSQAVAALLAPALLVHFALVFPERSIARRLGHRFIIAGTYVVPAILLLVHVDTATGTLGFVPSLAARIALYQLELSYLALYFLLAAGIFLYSYQRAPSGVLRQQLKWVTGGTLAGIVPFGLLYVLPFSLGAVPQPWMNVSAISLALLPLCFAYAIIRYRLMDVDIIFKRGLAYTAATGGVVAVYVAMVALIGVLFHATPNGLTGEIAAIVVAAFLFQPLREWIQARLDRFFYRDRFNYRRTLMEFGRTLTNEVRLEPMLASVMDRLSQTLLVDRLALFTEDPPGSGRYSLARSMGLRAAPPGGAESLDLSFLSPDRPAFGRGYLFYESPRAAREESESVRRTLEQLDLNYFIPCRMRDQAVAILGIGKTVDGDFLSSEDVELLFTLAGYVAIALDNARLYSSLEHKALQFERLKDFSENIVESLNVGVLAVDLDGRVESWNTQLEQLIGVPRSEAVGRRLDEVLPATLVAELAARSEEDHVSSLYKLAMRNRDGRNLVVNVSIAPLVGKEGERIGRLILLDDITQRTHLEDQLLQAEKLTSLGLLAAGVAHEVNTPLAVISNYIQMLAKQLPAGDARQSLIDKIVKQTFRASEIVNHLLNFSRTGAAEFQPVSLNQVVEETLSLLTHPFRTGQVQVIRNLSPELPTVLGSGNRLQQVFLNLFLNARDAMPSGGMLEVRSSAHNGSVEVEVTDTGAGISREDLARIFDPFFTTKATARGTGLGLSVSYGIIKEHAGKIEVRSTPGKGTSLDWNSRPPQGKQFMPKGSILVIDDETEIREGLELLLTSEGYAVALAETGESGLSLLGQQPFDLVLLDVSLPDRNGLDLLREIRQRESELPVILITAYGSIDMARSAFKSGAQDYITKPWSNDELLAQVALAIEGRRLREENVQLKRALKERYNFPNIIGKSERIQAVLDLVAQVAPSRSTVLIAGESGTGKELIAKAIHSASTRADKAFVPVNSGSIPVDLLESQLFGHVKGAFTGAVASRKGLFEAADQGTIFFDEIATISPETQAKLLRVIQEREFMRLGGSETIKVDVRILAASNVDVLGLVREGRFREDLYHRLNVIGLEMPPLRDRREDIPLLLEHFLRHFSKDNDKSLRRFTPAAMKALMDYSWPGNVRELENVVERAVVLSTQDLMDADLLPESVRTQEVFGGVRLQLSEFLPPLPGESGARTGADSPSPSLFQVVEEFERRVITDMLERTAWSQTEAAERFQIPLSTLNQKIKRLGIEIRRRNPAKGPDGDPVAHAAGK